MIWLVGDKGMLGTELSRLFLSQNLSYIGSDRDVDILDPTALTRFAAGKGIRWIINCAAYTAVDKAEDEVALAEALNAQGPENLARTAKALGARLIHISTDYVFSGQASAPIAEDEPVAPQGVYGRTKAEGERRVMAADPTAIILRTAWLYGKHGPNFVYTMLRLMNERQSIGVVADQLGSPTWAADLAAAVANIVTRPDFPAGIFHYTNGGQTSWHGFALEIQRLGRELGLLTHDCLVNPLRTDEFPTKARRPAYSVLSKAKLQALGVQVPGWEESLRKHLAEVATIARRQRQWFKVVGYDFRSAEIEAEMGRYRSCAFWCQQSVEKTLKALLEFHERPLPVHDVFKLANKLRLPLEEGHADLLKRLAKLYTESRYDFDLDVDESPVSKKEATGLLEASREFIQWARKQNRLPIG